MGIPDIDDLLRNSLAKKHKSKSTRWNQRDHLNSALVSLTDQAQICRAYENKVRRMIPCPQEYEILEDSSGLQPPKIFCLENCNIFNINFYFLKNQNFRERVWAV